MYMYHMLWLKNPQLLYSLPSIRSFLGINGETPLKTVKLLQCPLPHYKTPAQPKQRVCAHPYIMCLSELCVLRLTWQTGLTGR